MAGDDSITSTPGRPKEKQHSWNKPFFHKKQNSDLATPSKVTSGEGPLPTSLKKGNSRSRESSFDKTPSGGIVEVASPAVRGGLKTDSPTQKDQNEKKAMVEKRNSFEKDHHKQKERRTSSDRKRSFEKNAGLKELGTHERDGVKSRANSADEKDKDHKKKAPLIQKSSVEDNKKGKRKESFDKPAGSDGFVNKFPLRGQGAPDREAIAVADRTRARSNARRRKSVDSMHTNEKVTSSHCYEETKIDATPPEAIEAHAAAWTQFAKAHAPHYRNAHSKKLKHLIRLGIPDAYRRDVWLAVSGGDKFLSEHPGYYEHRVEIFKSLDAETLKRRAPTFGQERLHYEDHPLNEQGILCVNRALCVLADNNANLNFCPFLSDLAMMLSVFCPEEELDGILQNLITRSSCDRHWWIPTTLGRHYLLGATFTSLAEEKLKVVFDIRKESPLDPASLARVALRIMDRFFVSYFPYQTCLRILDAYLNEGIKVLYRVTMALYRLAAHTNLDACKSEQDVEDCLRRVAQACTTGKILQQGFAIKHLSRKKISKYDADNTISLRYVIDREHGISHKETPKERALRIRKWNDFFGPPPEKAGFVAGTGTERLSFQGSRGSFENVNTQHFHGGSSVLNSYMKDCIYKWLPQQLQIRDCELIYRAERDGWSLQTFFNCIGDAAKGSTVYPTLMIVEAGDEQIFGMFATHAWEPHKNPHFYGSPECFLFTLRPHPQMWRWESGRSKLFQLCQRDFIAMGGGGRHTGLWLDHDLHSGTSGRCHTFENEPLHHGGTLSKDAIESTEHMVDYIHSHTELITEQNGAVIDPEHRIEPPDNFDVVHVEVWGFV